MKPIDRIFEYFDYKHIKPTVFEKKIGLSNGYFGTMRRRNSDIGSNVVELIVNNCPDLSPEWLMFGKGEMIKTTPLVQAKEKEKKDTNNEIEYLRMQVELQKQLIEAKQKLLDAMEEDIRELKKKYGENNNNHLTPHLS